MGDAVRLNAYFERIGFAGSIAPTLATLEALHLLQPAAIPFENIDLLLGLPARLDQAGLEQKLLDEHRGGTCVELNLLLLRVLLELGFGARPHLAKVLAGAAEDRGRKPDHMLLGVDIAGTTWLADAGFGGRLQTAPLKLLPDLEQETPLGTYRIVDDSPALRLEFRRDENWWPAYRFTLDVADEEASSAVFAGIAGEAHGFLREHLLVERAAATGRATLLDARLSVEEEGGRQERRLGSVAEIRDTLAGTFGIAPPAAEGLDAALAQVLGATVG